MDIQCQSLDKRIKMAKIFKGKLDQTHKSNAIWIVTTIKRIILKTVKEFGLPVLSFKHTQKVARNNNQMLAAFNGNLGA